MVDPLKFDFDGSDVLPFGWIQYTHPEGARYFFHKEKRIYTDANLYDPEEFLIISESANQILGDLEIKAQDDNIELPSDIELALEIIPTEEGPICGYYFINHKSRCLFWLEEFDAEGICSEINAVVSLSHLRYEIEAQYWAHWELFPNTRDVTVEIVDRLRSIALHAAAGSLNYPALAFSRHNYPIRYSNIQYFNCGLEQGRKQNHFEPSEPHQHKL
jgi:hypothetical protein